MENIKTQPGHCGKNFSYLRTLPCHIAYLASPALFRTETSGSMCAPDHRRLQKELRYSWLPGGNYCDKKKVGKPGAEGPSTCIPLPPSQSSGPFRVSSHTLHVVWKDIFICMTENELNVCWDRQLKSNNAAKTEAPRSLLSSSQLRLETVTVSFK